MNNIYADVDINLKQQSDGDVLLDTDVDAIINSLTNIVLTIPGSRRMLPTFAFDGYDLLFEPIDSKTAEKLGHHLISAIETWDDRIIIDRMLVVANHDYNRYDVTCNFTIKGFGSSESFREVNFILKQL